MLLAHGMACLCGAACPCLASPQLHKHPQTAAGLAPQHRAGPKMQLRVLSSSACNSRSLGERGCADGLSAHSFCLFSAASAAGSQQVAYDTV
jgi:hypothetical protein